MSISYLFLEVVVILGGIGLLLADLWTPSAHKRSLGYAAAALLGLALMFSFSKFVDTGSAAQAFGGMYVQDALSLFFKRFFLVAAILVLLMQIEFSDRIGAGLTEYYSLTLFALAGMMTAASANDFSLLFVSLELMAVSFYVLTSFQRSHVASLEAGVKYLILGALSSAFLVYGIALVYGAAGTMNFTQIASQGSVLKADRLAVMGFLFVFVGLGFKVAVFPMQVWVPDVYQGAPSPTSAFLSVGSKAAGFVLLLRVFHGAAPDIALSWERLLMILSAVTMLYGSLCAIPQRNLKRLLGYSSIANAGYLFLGLSAGTASGSASILYYLLTYLFAVVAAFFVICIVSRQNQSDDIGELAGLSRRSPLLAAVLTLAMVSLAGVPPLGGFFGKFMLLRAAAEQGVSYSAYYWLVGIAVFGVVVSMYYYFGVIRAIYWSKDMREPALPELSAWTRGALWFCVCALLFLGIFPSWGVVVVNSAVAVLRF